MLLSSEGAKILVEREGYKTEAYKDTKGIWTIGVGHTGPEVHEGLVWDEEEIISNFRADCAWATTTVNMVRQPLNQNMFDALVSFVYNIGGTAFLNSTMFKFLNMGMYRSAWLEFDRWHVPPEITDRRNQEKAQFATPVDPDNGAP